MKRPSVFRALLSTVLTRPTARVLAPSTHPTDRDGWKAHWMAQGQPWRTEPVIDAKRQQELSVRRAIVPDIEKGIYPFKGVKLERADVEWLLATHDNGRGPIYLREEGQYKHHGPDLRGANLNNANLSRLPLARIHCGLNWDEWIPATQEQREMAGAYLNEANLSRAHLEGAFLNNAHMEKANCSWAYLIAANLPDAHLEHAYLYQAHLEGASLMRTHLERCDLSGAFFDAVTNLKDIHMSSAALGIISLVDISWNGANLSVVNWSSIKMLGHERKAKKSKQLADYQTAVRANRQLAVALQEQGLNEDAARFAYRAQVLQRKVLWIQHKFWKWLGSAILALLAGYGYRMWRIIAAYLIIISACAVAYFILGIYFSPHISPSQAFLESITAFHGRVFYELFNPNQPQIWVTAFEAVAGLIIEGVFIAMLAQRFFGK